MYRASSVVLIVIIIEEKLVRFPLPDGVFYLMITGWILTSTYYVRIQ